MIEVLAFAEDLAAELDCDPYPSFYLLGLLTRSEAFRAAVRAAGGDPDRGAAVIREDLEFVRGEGRTGDTTHTRTESDLLALVTALFDDVVEPDWVDPRMNTAALRLTHVASVYDPSLDVSCAAVLRAMTPAADHRAASGAQ